MSVPEIPRPKPKTELPSAYKPHIPIGYSVITKTTWLLGPKKSGGVPSEIWAGRGAASKDLLLQICDYSDFFLPITNKDP